MTWHGQLLLLAIATINSRQISTTIKHQTDPKHQTPTSHQSPVSNFTTYLQLAAKRKEQHTIIKTKCSGITKETQV
jgi:hypothetical protein